MLNSSILRQQCDFVKFFWKEFIIFHGFPGDNPGGLIFSQKGNIITEFGECCEYEGDLKSVKEFLKWYQDKIDDDPRFFQILDEEEGLGGF